MARKSPGALRAQPAVGAHEIRTLRPIDGLSSRTNAAIVRLQIRRRGLDSVTTAFAGYRRMVLGSGRWLNVPFDDCPCPGCDSLHHRDVLEDAMRWLPPAAARELRRAVTTLDEQFRRKTLPDPRAAGVSRWVAERWWRQRLQDR